MLVLGRRAGEGIVIKGLDGGEVYLQVLEIRGRRGQVKLGFEAPAEIKIWREELLESGECRADKPKAEEVG